MKLGADQPDGVVWDQALREGNRDEHIASNRPFSKESPSFPEEKKCWNEQSEQHLKWLIFHTLLITQGPLKLLHANRYPRCFGLALLPAASSQRRWGRHNPSEMVRVAKRAVLSMLGKKEQE